MQRLAGKRPFRRVPIERSRYPRDRPLLDLRRSPVSTPRPRRSGSPRPSPPSPHRRRQPVGTRRRRVPDPRKTIWRASWSGAPGTRRTRSLLSPRKRTSTLPTRHPMMRSKDLTRRRFEMMRSRAPARGGSISSDPPPAETSRSSMINPRRRAGRSGSNPRRRHPTRPCQRGRPPTPSRPRSRSDPRPTGRRATAGGPAHPGPGRPRRNGSDGPDRRSG